MKDVKGMDSGVLSRIPLSVVPEEEKKNGEEPVLERDMTWGFLRVIERHQSSHPGCSTDSEHNKLKDIHSKYITVKQHNIKEKGILKVAREKRQITYKGITVRQWVTYQ